MLLARRLACIVLCAATVTAPPARAQAPGTAVRSHPARVRDALSGEALAAFDRASLLFASRNFGPARAEFERAHELGHEPRVLYNVAVCDKELGRYARAIARLRQSLDEGGAALAPRYVATVNETIALLEPLVTKLVVDSDDGATVLLDGEEVGTLPLPSPLPVDVGEHDVLVRKVGFVDLVRHVSALGGHPTELHVRLAPVVRRGQLRITASGGAGSAASVILDGNDVGNAPWQGEVAAGVHAVAVRAPGYSGPSREVDVEPSGTTDLAFTLVPDARLRITLDDETATVRLDGAVIGRGGFDAPVPSGEHTLVVSRPDGGGTPFREEIALGRGETRSMGIQIHRGIEVPAWVWIGGGTVIVAGAATVAVLLLTATKKYEGSSPGTLNPGLIPTGLRVGSW